MKVKGVKTFVGEEDKLEKLVAKFGPVAVTISRHTDALYYKSGVYSCSKKQSSWNDWILVVGYGSDSKFGDYWILVSRLTDICSNLMRLNSIISRCNF